MNYVGVVGAAECSQEVSELARAVGRGLARQGITVICGGRGGVMEAAARGVAEENGTTIGILPGKDRAGANPYLTYSIPTALGDARNAIIASACDALIAIGGGYGTLSEIALARKMGKPVVGLKTWEANNGNGKSLELIPVSTPEHAVSTVVKLLNHPPSC